MYRLNNTKGNILIIFTNPKGSKSIIELKPRVVSLSFYYPPKNNHLTNPKGTKFIILPAVNSNESVICLPQEL